MTTYEATQRQIDKERNAISILRKQFNTSFELDDNQLFQAKLVNKNQMLAFITAKVAELVSQRYNQAMYNPYEFTNDKASRCRWFAKEELISWIYEKLAKVFVKNRFNRISLKNTNEYLAILNEQFASNENSMRSFISAMHMAHSRTLYFEGKIDSMQYANYYDSPCSANAVKNKRDEELFALRKQ